MGVGRAPPDSVAQQRFTEHGVAAPAPMVHEDGAARTHDDAMRVRIPPVRAPSLNCGSSVYGCRFTARLGQFLRPEAGRLLTNRQPMHRCSPRRTLITLDHRRLSHVRFHEARLDSPPAHRHAADPAATRRVHHRARRENLARPTTTSAIDMTSRQGPDHRLSLGSAPKGARKRWAAIWCGAMREITEQWTLRSVHSAIQCDRFR